MEKDDYRKRLEIIANQLFYSGAHADVSTHLLHFLMSVLCGYDRPSIMHNKVTADIMANSCIYNDARRDIWLEFRSLLHPTVLAKVETNYEPMEIDTELHKQESKEHEFLKQVRRNADNA